MKAFGSLAACAAWLISSTAIIVVNRTILVEKQFPYPMAVASMGMAVSGIAGFIVCDILRLVPPVKEMSVETYLWRVIPVGVAQGLAGWLSNGLYIYLTLSFIEMARATLPLFTMIALHFSGLETPTLSMVKAVVLTTVGCAVAAYGEVHLSFMGILEAGRLVMIQFMLIGLEYHPLQGIKLIAPGAVGSLLLLSSIYELPSMVANNAGRIVLDNLPLFATAACLGLVVNLMSMTIIKLSSATTLKVLAAVRGPLVVLSGVILLSEVVTGIEAVGYMIALAGFTWYQQIKIQQDMGKSKQEEPTKKDEDRQLLLSPNLGFK
eukprot:gene6458-3091_t